jgi:DNA-binding NarL/FixJ family response regulator
MLKNLNDLELQPLKSAEKKSEELKELQFAANALLFPFEKNYISPSECTVLVDKLTQIGMRMKDVEGSAELIKQLRKIVSTLKNYKSNFQWTDDDREKTEKTVSYLVVQYLKKKRTNELTPEVITKLLNQWKRIYNHLVMPTQDEFQVNVKAFMSARQELLELFVKSYAI